MLGLSLGLILAGCRPRDAATETLERSHVARLAALFQRFRTEHRGKLPGSLDELKAFAAVQPVSPGGAPIDLEVLLISERDQQPLVVPWGKPIQVGGMTVVCYERQGRDGKRLVGYQEGVVEELDASQFQAGKP
jgi:hypothetical protein